MTMNKVTFDLETVQRMIAEAVKAESKKAYLEGLDSGIKAEREACAKLCEEERINATHYSAPTQSNWLAKKIRAR
jgi:hypothetical protein